MCLIVGPVNSTSKISDSCIRDLGFNPRSLIGWKFLKKRCLTNLINMCKDFEKQN